MQSVTAPVSAPTLGDGVLVWSQLCDLLDQRASLDARIVALAGRVQRSGTIEEIEGLTLDAVLSRTHQLPQAERSMLLTAADVLASMPATTELFDTGGLSWGQVRGIVAEARRLPEQQRGRLDAHIAASQDMFSKLDPDDAVDAVRVVAAELRSLRSVEAAEQRQAAGNFFYGQPGMFDRGRVYGELDNCSLAALLTNVDAVAPPDDGRSLGQRRADGLLTLATHRCDPAEAHADEPERVTDGNPAATKRTRHPLLRRGRGDFVVLIDWREVNASAAGLLQIDAPGCIPTVSAALLESLAADATVRAVLTDGGRPLTVTKKIRAQHLPADIRLAVKARDRADRFPGSRRPIAHVHHRNKKGEGHHIDHLAGLSGPSHTRLHRFGWRLSIAPNGEMTFTRGERSWTTLPRGTRLRRPPPRDPSSRA